MYTKRQPHSETALRYNFFMQQKLYKEYSRYSQGKQLVFPLNVESMIPSDETVGLLDQVLEELDYRKLYLTYSDMGRNPSVDPVSMFKVMVYAYSQGIYSTRRIEEACRYDVRYRYLLDGQSAPDHNTISRFRKDHLRGDVLDDLFMQFMKKLRDDGEISLSEVFIDGTKIEANANKYTFVFRRSTETFYRKLRAKASDFLKNEFDIEEAPDQIDASKLQGYLDLLKKRVTDQKIKFVYGQGHRKTLLQRQYETIKGWQERASRYEEIFEIIGEGRNSYSKTDHDATFMHMKEDHMRNGQLKAGYNVQVATESEYILGIHVSADRSDLYTLIPFLSRLEQQYGSGSIKRVCADAGYESEENYDFLKTHDIQAFIKPSNYEYSKTRKFQKDMEFRLSMNYDPEEDSYTCKNGRKLKYAYTSRRTMHSGYVSEKKIYTCESCEGCPFLGKCYRGKYSKKLIVSPAFDSYREESRKNITSEDGILLRINRSIQAEGVFAITKQDMGFTRFLTRGKSMVTTEYLLLAFGFNINKLHSRMRNGRYQTALFVPKNLKQTA